MASSPDAPRTTPTASLCAFLEPKPDADGFLTCERCEQKGAPWNLTASCASARGLEHRADALIAYANSLPDGVMSEALAEANNLRRQAVNLRVRSAPQEYASTVRQSLVPLRDHEAIEALDGLLTQMALLRRGLVGMWQQFVLERDTVDAVAAAQEALEVTDGI